MEKDVRIGPTQPGSFGGAQALEQIQERRTAEAIERGRAEEKAGKEKHKETDERDKEIESLLPKKIASVFGEIPFKTFKKMYKSVWEQVENKEHFARGFCTFSYDVSKNLPIVFRTFRVNETVVINRFAADPGLDFNKFIVKDSAYRTIQLVLGIQEFDGKELEPLKMPTGDFDEWKDSEAVQARFDWIGGLPEELTALMSGILTDVTIAYRLALRENLKNQFAPL